MRNFAPGSDRSGSWRKKRFWSCFHRNIDLSRERFTHERIREEREPEFFITMAAYDLIKLPRLIGAAA